MKTFNGNMEAAGGFIKDALGIIAKDNVYQSWLTEGNRELDELADFLRDLPNVDKGLKESLVNRVSNFRSCIKNGKSIINPNNKDDAKKAQNLKNFESGLNFVMNTESREGTNYDFVKDIATLLNAVGHSKVDDPQYKALLKIAQFSTEMEGLADSKHKSMMFDEIKSEVDTFNEEKRQYNEKFNSVVRLMGEIEPELSETGLQTHINSLENYYNRAVKEREKYTSPEEVRARDDKRKSILQIIEQREEDAKTQAAIIEEKREKANIIKNDSEFSLSNLEQNGQNQFNEIQQSIDNSNSRITGLESELADARNRKKMLSDAEKLVKQKKEELDKLLDSEDAKESYYLFRNVQKAVATSHTAKELLGELSNPELKNDIYPALYENGIISVLGQRKNPNDQNKNLPQYQFKKEIAEKYVMMRQAIIDSSRNPKAAEEEFNKIENFNKNLANIIGTVNEKFSEEINNTLSSGISFSMEMASKIEESPWTRIDGMNEKTKELEDAEKALNEIKLRLQTTRDEKTIQENIKAEKDAIADKERERLDLINGYLKHFGREPVNKSMSYGDVLGIGVKIYAEIETDVKQADEALQKLQDIREMSRLKNELNSVSKDTEFEKIKLLGNNERDYKAKLDNAKKLMSDYASLKDDYTQLAEKHERIQKRCTDTLNAADFSHAIKGLKSVSEHIHDATRFGHSNTEQFKNMDSTLTETLNGLNDNNLTREQKIVKLKELKRAADTYIAAKKAQRASLGTAMRKARLANAELISKIAGNEVARQEALIGSQGYKDVQKVANEKKMNKNITDEAFKSTFKAAQRNHATAQRNLAQNRDRSRENIQIEAPENISILNF